MILVSSSEEICISSWDTSDKEDGLTTQFWRTLQRFSEPFGFYIKLIILHAYQQVIQRKFFCVGIVIICSKRNIILAFISVIIDIAHPPLYTSFSDLYCNQSFI